MSTSEDQTPEPTDGAETPGIDDEQLPEDLQPGEDNPLAEGLDDGETVDDLLEDGKHAEQSDQSEESDRSEESEESEDSGAS